MIPSRTDQQGRDQAMTIQRLHTGKRISRVVIHKDTVYLAGIVPLGKRGAPVKEQTEDVLASIDRLLAQAGTDKTRLLSANVWLADIRDAEVMNEVWENWVPDDCAPARATVESRLPSPLYAIKVAVIAAR
jgi:enamine deaminase RidA (YjgF/YER057c/UK114 family)